MDSASARKSVLAMQPIDQVKNVHVVFDNGTEIDGFISHWGNSVTLTKHSVLRNEDPHVALNFDLISSIEIEFIGGRTIVLP